jgi:hypothetical protein
MSPSCPLGKGDSADDSRVGACPPVPLRTRGVMAANDPCAWDLCRCPGCPVDADGVVNGFAETPAPPPVHDCQRRQHWHARGCWWCRHCRLAREVDVMERLLSVLEDVLA